jgi:hypothetical protein
VQDKSKKKFAIYLNLKFVYKIMYTHWKKQHYHLNRQGKTFEKIKNNCLIKNIKFKIIGNSLKLLNKKLLVPIILNNETFLAFSLTDTLISTMPHCTGKLQVAKAGDGIWEWLQMGTKDHLGWEMCFKIQLWKCLPISLYLLL